MAEDENLRFESRPRLEQRRKGASDQLQYVGYASSMYPYLLTHAIADNIFGSHKGKRDFEKRRFLRRRKRNKINGCEFRTKSPSSTGSENMGPERAKSAAPRVVVVNGSPTNSPHFLAFVAGQQSGREYIAKRGWRATLDEDEHYVYAVAL